MIVSVRIERLCSCPAGSTRKIGLGVAPRERGSPPRFFLRVACEVCGKDSVQRWADVALSIEESANAG